jgi:hypothetical protein
MPMNSGPPISVSEFSGGQWADEPPEPPHHPAGSSLIASVRSWLGEPGALARVTSPLADMAALTFARYLIAFFIGVVVTVVWQSSGRGTKEETVAAAPAALDLMRQSIDTLAAEVARIRALEQIILERLPASPPQPVAPPARNPALRPPPVR